MVEESDHAEPGDAKAPTVMFKKASCLGGLPSLKKSTGNLYVTVDGIGVGMLKARHLLPMTQITDVSVMSDAAAKSKVGAEIAFGVFGGLGGKGTQDRTTIACHTKVGDGYFQVLKMDAPRVKAMLAPVLRAANVPFSDDLPPAAPTPTVSVADELAKFAALRDAGAMTQDEFDAQKARLLAP